MDEEIGLSFFFVILFDAVRPFLKFKKIHKALAKIKFSSNK